MNENNGSNAADIIGSIFGTGGVGGAASGAGQIICAIKGTCPPNTVVYQTGGGTGAGAAMAGLLLPIIILVGIVALFYFLAKKK